MLESIELQNVTFCTKYFKTCVMKKEFFNCDFFFLKNLRDFYQYRRSWYKIWPRETSPFNISIRVRLILTIFKNYLKIEFFSFEARFLLNESSNPYTWRRESENFFKTFWTNQNTNFQFFILYCHRKVLEFHIISTINFWWIF